MSDGQVKFRGNIPTGISTSRIAPIATSTVVVVISAVSTIPRLSVVTIVAPAVPMLSIAATIPIAIIVGKTFVIVLFGRISTPTVPFVVVSI